MIGSKILDFRKILKNPENPGKCQNNPKKAKTNLKKIPRNLKIEKKRRGGRINRLLENLYFNQTTIYGFRLSTFVPFRPIPVGGV